MAGLSRVCALERSPDAARTYYHNFICREEISKVSWEEYLKLKELQVSSGLIVGDVKKRMKALISSCGLYSKTIDIVAGGPPCQGYSLAGKRDPKDPRNKLANQMVKAVSLLNPKVVLMENVPAMNSPFPETNKGSAIAKVIKKLNRNNYITQVLHLKASVFGVPQERERIFLVGIRKDVYANLPAQFNLGEYVDKNIKAIADKQIKKCNVKDALSDIANNGYRLTKRNEYRSLPYASSLRFNPKLAVLQLFWQKKS